MTITVELVADVTEFNHAITHAGTATMTRALANLEAMAKQWEAAMTGVHDVLARTSTVELGRFEMRLEGQHQKAIALGWWDTHLNDVYADLGLPRDPHLTRGEN